MGIAGKWIAKTVGAALMMIASGTVSLQTARGSIPKPPENPGWIDLAVWAFSGGDILALGAALVSGAGTAGVFYQLFFQSPYTAKQGRKDRAHQNASFKATDERSQQRHRENLSAHDATQEMIRRDKHDQALEDIQNGRATPELLARYRQALGIRREDGSTVNQRDAAQFALEADRAAQSDDPRIREIAELIGEGKIVEASDRKASIAEETVQTAARELRAAGYLALPVSRAKALEHFKRATELDPGDLWAWIELGRLRKEYEGLQSARTCFEIALQHVDDPRDRSVLHDEFGAVLVAEGQLAEALSEFEAALSIAQSLAAADPSSAAIQRDLSVSYTKIGDVQHDQGDSAAALASYRQSLAIAESLAAADPSSAAVQRDLWVSCWKLAAQGDPDTPWSKVAAMLEAMAAAGTLLPVDEKFLIEARRLAGDG